MAISFLKGADIEDDLVALRNDRRELAGAVNHALVGIGSRSAGEIFAERLRHGRYDVTLFRDLSETGNTGHDAGPVLVELLQSEDWDTRLHAARTLGYIGYRPAVPMLASMLERQEDVRLNWVAAESLGRMLDTSALPSLDDTASNHWHPVVRQAAVAATQHIRNGTTYRSEFHERNFAFDFFSYQHAFRSGTTYRKWSAHVREPESTKLYQDRNSKRLESLAFKTEIISYGAREEVDPPQEEGRIITITPDNIIEHRTPHRQVPHVALRVSDGWLVGSNRGEWGGELAFVGDDGSGTVVAHVNVEDIYMLGDRTLAITGLAHLSGNSGMILAVERDMDGTWSARPWRSLSGAPTASWPTTGNKLLIQTVGGDGLLLSSDGGMQMAECRNKWHEGRNSLGQRQNHRVGMARAMMVVKSSAGSSVPNASPCAAKTAVAEGLRDRTACAGKTDACSSSAMRSTSLRAPASPTSPAGQHARSVARRRRRMRRAFRARPQFRQHRCAGRRFATERTQHVEALDVAAAFPDRIERRLPVEPRQDGFLHVAGAAQAFLRLVDEGRRALADPVLADGGGDAGEGRFGRVAWPRVHGTRDAHGQRRGSLRFDGEIGQHVAHERLFDQPLAEGGTMRGMVDGLRQRHPHSRRGTEHAIQPRQHHHLDDDRHAAAFFADPPGQRIVEFDFGGALLQSPSVTSAA